MMRKWFQIHLSTAIVLMLSAGTLLGLNFLPINKAYNLRLGRSSPSRLMYVERGWPTTFSRAYDRPLLPHEFPAAKEAQLSSDFQFFRSSTIIANVSFSVIILLAGVFTIEGLIRRREARKP